MSAAPNKSKSGSHASWQNAGAGNGIRDTSPIGDQLTDYPLPQDHDAERALLCGILRDPDVLPAVQQIVGADNFYFDAHQSIFRAVCELVDEIKPVKGDSLDLVMLRGLLRRKNQLEDVGGKNFLDELFDVVMIGASAQHHAQLVREAADRRNVIRTARNMIRDALSPVGPADAVVARAEASLSDLATRTNRHKARAYSPRLYTSAEFFDATFPREYLVRGVLVKGQPAVLGGVKKTLKSGFAIDLAISLDTATAFLGHERFGVPRRANVMLLNGESGNATMQETAARIAEARQLDPRSLQIVWGDELPQLANVEHLHDLSELLKELRIEVLMVDPAYLCLMSGVRKEAQASSLFDMGEIYSQFARCCQGAGTTPILTVHAKKGRGHDPLDLDDLTYAGVAEFARQWLLISRRDAYEGDGLHRLWLNVGGSAGHSFLGQVDVNEGVVDDEFKGREWNTTVESFRDTARGQKAGRNQAKLEEQQADEQAIANLIDRMTSTNDPATLNRIRNGSGLSRPRTDGALERLRLAQVIEPYTANVPKGNRATQPAVAYRRKPD